MQPPYRARYRFTRDEMLRSMAHHYRNPTRRLFLVGGHLVALLFVALALFIVATSEVNGGDLLTLGALILFPLYWWLFRERVNRWGYLRGFDQRPDANALVEWALAPEGFRAKIEGLSTTEGHWSLLMKVVETRDGFLLYPQRNAFFWLPFSAFEPPEAVEGARDLLAASVAPYERRGG